MNVDLGFLKDLNSIPDKLLDSALKYWQYWWILLIVLGVLVYITVAGGL